jgi:excisionase family DNA binding protein
MSKKSILELSKDPTYRLPHLKGFPAIRFGRTIRVPRDAFFRWLDDQAAQGLINNEQR